jgi:drug/metabolite transporter (DMT)-like permease
MNHVYKISDVTMTQPYSFFGLIVASMYGYLIFNEVPDIYTWIGGVIIFIGVTLITLREIQLNKDIVRHKININP